MIRTILIEDEAYALKKLLSLLDAHAPKVEVVHTLDSVAGAVAWFHHNPLPDLIFLDVELKDGSAFEIFEQVNIDVPVIFTTAHDRYALEAFQLNSISYLLKPVTEAALISSLEKMETVLSRTFNYQKLIDAFQSQQHQDRFMVFKGELIKSLNTSEIAYFLSKNKKVWLVDHQNNQYYLTESLNKLEKKLDPRKFFRINRELILHIQSIVHMVNYSRSRVKLVLHPPLQGDSIVSVERSARFKLWLDGQHHSTS